MQLSARGLAAGSAAIILGLFLAHLILVTPALAQSTYTAQLSGVVTDTNTPRFAFPDLAFGSGTFGDVTSTAPGSTPRHTQFGLRFQF